MQNAGFVVWWGVLLVSVTDVTSGRGISIVLLRDLKPHERTSGRKVKALAGEIRLHGLKKPLLVDVKSFTILDGHHRALALKLNGCKFAPATLVDYSSGVVVLKPRRKNLAVSKAAVVERASAGLLYPRKTTRHILLDQLEKRSEP